MDDELVELLATYLVDLLVEIYLLYLFVEGRGVLMVYMCNVLYPFVKG